MIPRYVYKGMVWDPTIQSAVHCYRSHKMRVRFTSPKTRPTTSPEEWENWVEEKTQYLTDFIMAYERGFEVHVEAQDDGSFLVSEIRPD